MSDFVKRINASDLIDWIMCAFPDWCEGSVREIVDHVNEMSPAQPEIIMCKDCKHHRENHHGDSWCAHSKGLDAFDLMPTDFCSRAERRTDVKANKGASS